MKGFSAWYSRRRIPAASVFDSEGETVSASARMIAWFSEFGAVFIPKIGFFIRSEALLNALSTEQNSQPCRAAARTLLGLAFHKRKQSALDANSRILALSCMYRAPRVRRWTAPSTCSAHWERERPPVWELLKQLLQQRKSQQPNNV